MIMGHEMAHACGSTRASVLAAEYDTRRTGQDAPLGCSLSGRLATFLVRGPPSYFLIRATISVKPIWLHGNGRAEPGDDLVFGNHADGEDERGGTRLFLQLDVEPIGDRNLHRPSRSTDGCAALVRKGQAAKADGKLRPCCARRRRRTAAVANDNDHSPLRGVSQTNRPCLVPAFSPGKPQRGMLFAHRVRKNTRRLARLSKRSEVATAARRIRSARSLLPSARTAWAAQLGHIAGGAGVGAEGGADVLRPRPPHPRTRDARLTADRRQRPSDLGGVCGVGRRLGRRRLRYGPA